MRRSLRSFAPVLVGLAFVILATGCSRSRAIDRAKVLEAENMNQRQKMATYQEQIRQQHLAQDSWSSQEQQLRAELLAAQQDARAAEQARLQANEARNRLVAVQNDLRQSETELADVSSKYEQLLRERQARPAPAPAVARRGGNTTVRGGGISPEAEAMRRDLQRQLASYGVRELNVEVRRDQHGERVAIVLPDAFKAGKATLADNRTAVKAVVGVGKLIKEHYPNSRVLVEGHTDSDPIRSSGWGTNERLSQARAQAVMSLLTNAGIPSGQVTTEGLGASRPLALGGSKRAKSRNRRVEIFITPGA